jgi:hypothetical protein
VVIAVAGSIAVVAMIGRERMGFQVPDDSAQGPDPAADFSLRSTFSLPTRPGVVSFGTLGVQPERRDGGGYAGGFDGLYEGNDMASPLDLGHHKDMGSGWAVRPDHGRPG